MKEKNEKTEYKMIRLNKENYDFLDNAKALTFSSSFNDLIEKMKPSIKDFALNFFVEYMDLLFLVVQKTYPEKNYTKIDHFRMLRNLMSPDFDAPSRYGIHPAVE